MVKGSTSLRSKHTHTHRYMYMIIFIQLIHQIKLGGEKPAQKRDTLGPGADMKCRGGRQIQSNKLWLLRAQVIT